MNQTHFWVTAATGGSYFNPLPKLGEGGREKQGGKEEAERETTALGNCLCFNSLRPWREMSRSTDAGREEAPAAPEVCSKGTSFLERKCVSLCRGRQTGDFEHRSQTGSC